jgi:hypothetical protein
VYIRTKEEALAAVADILDLPERRRQIIQSSIAIMTCLDCDPRDFLVDCQALLIEGGLEALRARRQVAIEAAEPMPLVVLDPEGDLLFRETASALDALRLSAVVRDVFPDLHHERWLVARALLHRELELRPLLADAIRARGNPEEFGRARAAVEALIEGERPSWTDRAGTLRAACTVVLRADPAVEADLLHEEAEALFEVFAACDRRAQDLLAAVDRGPHESVLQVVQLRDVVSALRSMPSDAGDVSRAA